MTNRERLARAIRDLEDISRDEVISPTPYTHLIDAIAELERARRFALDMNERDGVKT